MEGSKMFTHHHFSRSTLSRQIDKPENGSLFKLICSLTGVGILCKLVLSFLADLCFVASFSVDITYNLELKVRCAATGYFYIVYRFVIMPEIRDIMGAKYHRLAAAIDEALKAAGVILVAALVMYSIAGGEK
jgi:hypothetical protein